MFSQSRQSLFNGKTIKVLYGRGWAMVDNEGKFLASTLDVLF